MHFFNYRKLLDLETEMRCPPIEELRLSATTPCVFYIQNNPNLICAASNLQKLCGWVEERLIPAKSEGYN